MLAATNFTVRKSVLSCCFTTVLANFTCYNLFGFGLTITHCCLLHIYLCVEIIFQPTTMLYLDHSPRSLSISQRKAVVLLIKPILHNHANLDRRAKNILPILLADTAGYVVPAVMGTSGSFFARLIQYSLDLSIFTF